MLFVAVQVVLGGGQYAGDVTRTDHRAGKFEAKFYDKVNHSTLFMFCSMNVLCCRLFSTWFLFFIFLDPIDS